MGRQRVMIKSNNGVARLRATSGVRLVNKIARYANLARCSTGVNQDPSPPRLRHSLCLLQEKYLRSIDARLTAPVNETLSALTLIPMVMPALMNSFRPVSYG